MRRTVAAIVALAGFGLAPGAHGQGLDQTCVLALAKFDPATLNIAYPDDSARYYVGAYAALPGTRIRITGTFPHARYMSFNVYDPQLRPIAAITDLRIVPDPGSANPFVAGADRTTTTGRSYTVFLEPGAPPATPAPNTLYTGVGQDGSPNLVGTFIYRIYVPDEGTGDTGGVGLPTVRVEPAGATAGGSPSPCAGLTPPRLAGVNEALANLSPPADPPQPGGANPPVWRKFVNLLSSVTINVAGTPAPGGLDLDRLGGSGGFLSNVDNAYVSAPTSRGFGKVLVTRFRAPTFPDTRRGTARMPSGQLRYWSVCQNDPPTQRFVACVNDDRAMVGDDGFVTVVVSTPAARPATATRACGANWLPWGADPRGVLIYRHMLPATGFTRSVQAATVDRERETMGDALPVSRYYADAAAYARGVPCSPPRGRAACRSARVVTITLRGRAARARRATVHVAGRRATSVPVRRGGRVRVDLRGLPRGSHRVRIVAAGRTVIRRFRTCTRG